MRSPDHVIQHVSSNYRNSILTKSNIKMATATTTRRSRTNPAGFASLLTEFFSCLVKAIWITIVSVVKTFTPVQKKDVRNEVVLVTGAGSGIGRLMSMRFAELGATVNTHS